MSTPAVEFDRVSKTYAIYDAPGDRLKELALLGRRSFHRGFRALSEVSFTVKRGEVFCLIGENGSGKSTALQLIAGILKPTEGEVRVNGRVSALLELGAGFNPEFTGRENVYLNGAIMGLSRKDIDSRYADIGAFAEIGDFIDRPVKTYSSGMVVRLAFAVAIHVDPDILLVDEALAVGDTYFRHRCMRKVYELRARGVTILFVSHSSADVRAIGERALWLRHGKTVAVGDVDTVLPQYLAEMSLADITTNAPAPVPSRKLPPTIPNIDYRHGDGRAELLGVAVLNEFGEPLHLMMPESRIGVQLTLRAAVDLTHAEAGFIVRNHLGHDFAEVRHTLPSLRAGETVSVDFHVEIPELYPGAFSFSPWIVDDGSVCDWIDNAVTVQMARGESYVYGYVHWPGRIEATRLA
jgi:lipopolysaccharide transport system ATP-binding protein